MGKIVTDQTYQIDAVPASSRRALLLNPPVYDAQYWARWSQPAGLLRIASLLRRKGYAIDLVDCMETDARGLVPKTAMRDTSGAFRRVIRDNVTKPLYGFGLTLKQLEAHMRALPTPDEVWITSIMTYWWPSTRDVVMLARRLFPAATILVGGIYPTLAPEHARDHLDADYIFQGELREASELATDLSLYATAPSTTVTVVDRQC